LAFIFRQFLDFKGFYDRDKLFWKDIIDVVLGCACAPPGGGRNPLTPRFFKPIEFQYFFLISIIFSDMLDILLCSHCPNQMMKILQRFSMASWAGNFNYSN